MRMRSRRNLENRLLACEPLFIKPDASSMGKWNLHFEATQPLHIEIGCGKGRFITQMALRHPDINFIAIERVSNVIVLAAEKAKALTIPNLRFVIGDVAILSECMAQGECSRIYLNFSDPWPKKGYAKRRLTHENFLRLYKKILAENGEIHMKTDNAALFEYSLNSFLEQGFQLKNISLNLHASSFEGNIMTEFEERFAAQGMPIYRLEAVVPPKN